MQESADMELARRYVRENSDEAFAVLVARYVNMVYSAALRRTGNPHSAEEITQAVFIILAKKAGKLGERTILSGWLYETARLTSANFLRAETRRVHREQEAYMQPPSNETESDVWRQIMPLLEEAMGRLGEEDRNAIALRFFEGKKFQEIGTAFGVSENAAKKRVAYALEKLRKFFTKRGVTSTSAVIAGALFANSVQAAPVALANSVTAVALAKGATVSGSTLTLINGALKIMAWTKAKMAIVAAVVVLLAAGTTTVTVSKIRSMRPENRVVWALDPKVLENEPPVVIIRPAEKMPSGKGGSTGGWYKLNDGKIIALHQQIPLALSHAFDIQTTRIIGMNTLPREYYDYLVSISTGQQAALQKALHDQFGLIGRRETRNMDVFHLTQIRADAPGLRIAPQSRGSTEEKPGKWEFRGAQIATFIRQLEEFLRVPVIDATGLSDVYDIDLSWPGKQVIPPSPSFLEQAVQDQLGLELLPIREPIELLVVERAK